MIKNKSKQAKTCKACIKQKSLKGHSIALNINQRLTQTRTNMSGFQNQVPLFKFIDAVKCKI